MTDLSPIRVIIGETAGSYPANVVPPTGLPVNTPNRFNARVVATGNISLSGTPIIDGYQTVVGDRVLAIGQTTTSANGVYVVAATGSWQRAIDLSLASQFAGPVRVSVEVGTAGLGKTYQFLPTSTVVIGTTSIIFTDADTWTKAEADGRYSRAEIISGRTYGAIFDGSPGDNALIKTAALYAATNKLPFVIPTAGLTLTVGSGGDFPSLQAAHDATLNWIIPSYQPTATSPTTGLPLLTFSLLNGTVTLNGFGVVWNHPLGDRILVKGQTKTPLSSPTKFGCTFAAGAHFLTLNTSALPAGIAVDDYVMVSFTEGPTYPTANFGHHGFRGLWQVSAVDVPNNRATLRVFCGTTDLTAATFTSITALWLRSALRVINMPFDGDDRGLIDVRKGSVLHLQDIALSGYSSGTNASSTNGIMLRVGARLHLEQHVGVCGFPRAGIWGVESTAIFADFAAVSNNDTGVNLLLGSACTGSYLSVNGNTSNNIVVGVGSSFSGSPLAAVGTTGACVYVLHGGSFIASGEIPSLVGFGASGVVTQDNSTATLNDLTVIGCTTGLAARGGEISVTSPAKVAGNTTNFSPSLNFLGASGSITNSASTVRLPTLMRVFKGTQGITVPAIAAGARDSTVTITVTGAVAQDFANVNFNGGALPADVWLADVLVTADTLTLVFENRGTGTSSASARTAAYLVQG